MCRSIITDWLHGYLSLQLAVVLEVRFLTGKENSARDQAGGSIPGVDAVRQSVKLQVLGQALAHQDDAP